ncbi:MAG: Uncharacterized protein FD134_2543, partial [Gallionellaceae bacterium]
MDTVADTSGAVSCKPEFPTTALPLPDSWKSILVWAAKNNACNSLIHIINAAQIHNHPDFLRPILNLLIDNDSFELLCEWADTYVMGQNPEPLTPAQYLYQMASAVIKDDSVFQLMNEIQTEMPSSRFLKGELKSCYLFAMLYQKPLDVGFGDQNWIKKLKLWLLTHAVDRAMSGNMQDQYIKIVSDDLRIACHKNRDKRKMFLALRRQITEFSALNRHLIYGTQLQLKKNPQTTKRWMLNSIIQVAKYQHNKIENVGQQQIPLPATASANGNWLKPPQPVMGEVHDDEESGSHTWAAGRPGGVGIAEVDADEKTSYFHQQLKATGILIYSMEDSSFLQWAWNRPSPIEMPQLDRWIEENSRSAKPENRFLAVLTWIATRLGRSFRRALDIRISDDVGDEWAINSGLTTLSRRPPQRKGGWQPDSPDRKQDQKNWVNPAAASISIRLPKNISRALKKEAAKSLGIKCLGDLWNAAWGERPESVLRDNFSRAIPRVLPGMLGSVQAQQYFNACNDPVFAKLACSHPNSSLPSACAYANWGIGQANTILNHESIALPLTASEGDNCIALGSRLDPIEMLIANSIRQAASKLEVLRQSQDPIAFHNAYSCYVAVALLAATGGRPINDAFESVAHFDFRERFVFINDKASGAAREGRLALLPVKVCELVGQHYLAHLGALARALKEASPALSAELESMSGGRPCSAMPLFFLLSPDFCWRSITEEMITGQKLFDWPLPLNLFRHRLSAWLRHHSADPEVIDSILGHAETGNATHWDCSFRIWRDDMEVLRPLVEQAFDALGFENIRGMADGMPYQKGAPDSGKTKSRSPEIFGIRAREKNRRSRFVASIRDAKVQIELYLEERKKKLGELSKDEAYELSKKLLFSESGLPHPAGHHKYRHLLRQIEKAWHKEGKRVHLSKRFVFVGEESRLFTEAAPHAREVLEEIRAAWSKYLGQPDRHRIPIQSLAFVAAVSLCIENRISSAALLKDIRSGKNFRLVALKGRAYLEYAMGLVVEDPGATAKRFRITADTATCLNQILKHQPLELTNHSVPDVLLPIAGILAEHRRVKSDALCNEVISALCDLVDQANALTLPGILAAYLAGRVDSYSLAWRDWIRLELGYAADIPAYKPDKKGKAGETAGADPAPAGGQVNIQHLSGADIEVSQQVGQALFKAID